MAHDIDTGAYIYGQLGWIDSWRLQKLTYYAQAWCLAWTGQPLFENKIEAWRDGPVAPTLHRVNKWESAPMSCDLPGADVGRLSANDRLVISAVLDYYEPLSKTNLIALTHEERPWKQAFNSGRTNAEITTGSMLSFYSGLKLTGAPVPARPPLAERQVSSAEFGFAAAQQSMRWREALDLLAQ